MKWPYPDRRGKFGPYGGRYVPDTLISNLEELEAAYAKARRDPSFWREFRHYAERYGGRPTPLFFAERWTRRVGGPDIYLKREDLNHTGSHKLNNCLGQVLLARRLGKSRIIAETGAGQHGVATATVCALFGLRCVVYMGEEDCRRQALNVYRMKLLGAEVVPVASGTRTLKDACNEAIRDWVTNVATTHYVLGSAMGPHPYPTIVRDFKPELLIFIAGADVQAGDIHGHFSLTPEGILRRDEYVVNLARSAGVPLVYLIGGGYFPSAWRTQAASIGNLLVKFAGVRPPNRKTSAARASAEPHPAQPLR